jgi:hypothetical protein
MDWYRNLRIILRQEKIEYVLSEPYPEDLSTGSIAAYHRAHERHCDDALNISYLMIATMSLDMQKQYKYVDAYTMIQGLRGMFENQVRTERYSISKALFVCKLTEGSLVNPHMIKMMGYIESLTKLGCEIKDDLATDVILQLLPMSYESFIMNFLMNDMKKTMAELNGMLKIVEDNIKKNPNHMMMVQKKKKKRKRWTPPKGKDKEKVSDEPSSCKPKKKGKYDPSPDEECFYYHKKKGSETFASGINIIEINITLSSSDSWVFDTGSMIHTCKLLQGLSLTRRFVKGDLDVHARKGAKVAVIAVGTFHLPLPLGLVLKLNNCCCIPDLCKNIISSSYLEEVDGYKIIIKNKRCLNYYNGIFYAHCLLVNELYVLDLEDKSVCNINTKMARLNDLNRTFIWDCCLGHINEKRIKRLHKDGLLNSFDFKSFDTCESCLLEKMTKAPFTGQSERASDLLGLVHTDVCGAMSFIARGDFQYFITFTDDFSRYEYIYLMRHKSESFEKFKEFQNEVQIQLGKITKFLQSDHVDEYLSLEFSDHLKQCEIVPQLTLLGMPQWNGMFEQRN